MPVDGQQRVRHPAPRGEYRSVHEEAAVAANDGSARSARADEDEDSLIARHKIRAVSRAGRGFLMADRCLLTPG